MPLAIQIQLQAASTMRHVACGDAWRAHVSRKANVSVLMFINTPERAHARTCIVCLEVYHSAPTLAVGSGSSRGWASSCATPRKPPSERQRRCFSATEVAPTAPKATPTGPTVTVRSRTELPLGSSRKPLPLLIDDDSEAASKLRCWSLAKCDLGEGTLLSSATAGTGAN